MFEKMHTIELSGETFPIKCDMVVLEQLQEIYGDLGKFEDRLLNLVTEKDDDGNDIIDKNGNKKYVSAMPDAKAVNDGLYLMVEEGMEIEGKDPVERKILLRKNDKSLFELTDIIHKEFMECFKSKKSKTETDQ